MKTKDLQLDWIKCFVAVVDGGSLSNAAGEIHRSQSAVSMQIKKLEEALGHRLLERDTRKLQLTPDGQTLLGYARQTSVSHQLCSNLQLLLPRARATDCSGG